MLKLPDNTVSTKHVWQCCSRILQALQGIKSVAVLIKWKGFQNVPVIFPLRKMINQQQRLETARCHGEPQQDRALGVCVRAQKAIKIMPISARIPSMMYATLCDCVRVCVCATESCFVDSCVSSKLCSRWPDNDLFSRVNFYICDH